MQLLILSRKARLREMPTIATKEERGANLPGIFMNVTEASESDTSKLASLFTLSKGTYKVYHHPCSKVQRWLKWPLCHPLPTLSSSLLTCQSTTYVLAEKLRKCVTFLTHSKVAPPNRDSLRWREF